MSKQTKEEESEGSESSEEEGRNIDWTDSTWCHEYNLKNYIKRYGNHKTNLGNKTYDELLQLAKNTEKALVLIKEDEHECRLCKKKIDDCCCYRCDECYKTYCKCRKKDQVQLVLFKTFVFSEKDERIDDKIQVLSTKMKLKRLFLEIQTSNVSSIDRLKEDLITLLEHIICIKYRLISNKTLIGMLQAVNEQSLDMQLIIYSEIKKNLLSQ